MTYSYYINKFWLTFRYKLRVADAVVSYIRPIQDSIGRHLSDKGYLLSVLAEGSEKASKIASKTLKEVHQKMGLRSKYIESIKKSASV